MKIIAGKGGKESDRGASATVTVGAAGKYAEAHNQVTAAWKAEGKAGWDAGKAFQLNIHQVLWRFNNRLSDGSPRHLYAGVDVSHQAESYHNAATWPGWHNGMKVEESVAETSEVNEDRKACTLFGRMWQFPDGTPMSPADAKSYVGPTACPHSRFGKPCFAPYPTDWRVPTFTTPKRTLRDVLMQPFKRSPKKPESGWSKSPKAKRSIGQYFHRAGASSGMVTGAVAMMMISVS